jgi:signal transduction histidine kinase
MGMKNFLYNKDGDVDLWTQYSNNSSGSLSIAEDLPKVAGLIANSMCVGRVAIWLRANYSDSAYTLEYCHAPTTVERSDYKAIRRVRNLAPAELNKTFKIGDPADSEGTSPIDNEVSLSELGITRYAFVGNDNQILAILGVGDNPGRETLSTEDDRFLLRVSDQFASLLVRHKRSEERSLAREWESLNRFTAFVIHDLKNLATVQSMTLENAKHLSHNPQFVSEALATFTRTTDKMIGLIASFTIQRGQFSLKQQAVNVLDVIHQTFEDLKLQQRNGIKLSTKFPPPETPPLVFGDPELLQKVFTNVLLNAIQSLPQGTGVIDISVVEDNAGKVIATVRDTGCGIPPEQLQNIFRPFQSTKESGMGIGLCHTLSIVEVHGGHIRIDSQVNSGTTVELEFPRI